MPRNGGMPYEWHDWAMGLDMPSHKQIGRHGIRLVLLEALTYVNGTTGLMYTTAETIARGCPDLDRKAVWAALTALTAAGVIEARGKRGRVNQYFVSAPGVKGADSHSTSLSDSAGYPAPSNGAGVSAGDSAGNNAGHPALEQEHEPQQKQEHKHISPLRGLDSVEGGISLEADASEAEPDVTDSGAASTDPPGKRKAQRRRKQPRQRSLWPSSVSTLGDRTSEPSPLPADWAPNWTHRKRIEALGIDLNETAADFRARWTGKRRRCWDKAFGAFLKAEEDGTTDALFPSKAAPLPEDYQATRLHGQPWD